MHAGFPNPAADKTFANLDIHQLLVQRPASTFLFRIAGNHWHEVGIFDSDIAVIDRALSPRQSDIVAWWHETHGEFELSYFRTVPKDGQVFGVVTATVHQFARGHTSKNDRSSQTDSNNFSKDRQPSQYSTQSGKDKLQIPGQDHAQTSRHGWQAERGR